MVPGISTAQTAELVFWVVVLFVTVYSLIMTYHWFSFGQNRRTATVATAVYLLGVAGALIVMASSLNFM